MTSPPVATVLCVCGSSLLAIWLAAAHQRFGPQTLRSSLLACALALVVLDVVQRSSTTIVDATDIAVTLLGVVVPSFGFAFWSSAVLIRAFIRGTETHRSW